jgi:hypothetical protein
MTPCLAPAQTSLKGPLNAALIFVPVIAFAFDDAFSPLRPEVGLIRLADDDR